MNEVLEFLKKYHVFYLATVEGDQPRVRPFGALAVFEGKLYTQTGNIKNVYKQIEANNKVELCCFGEGQWLRLECKLVRDDRFEARKAVLDQCPSLRKKYSETDGNCEVLRFEDCVATFNGFGVEPRTVTF